MNRVFDFCYRLGELLKAVAQVFRSRYVRELEAENARLRDREAALLNTILVSRGLPPLGMDNGKGKTEYRPGPRKTWAEVRAAWEAKDAALAQQEARKRAVKPNGR